MKEAEAPVKQSDNDESLPTLVGRVADDLTELLDAKLALLKIEVREEVSAYIRASVMMIAGLVVAMIGFALINVAGAFLISTLLQNTSLSQPARYALGFAITAILYLVGAGALILLGKNRLAEHPLIPPRTVAELKKDKEKIEEEI